MSRKRLGSGRFRDLCTVAGAWAATRVGSNVLEMRLRVRAGGILLALGAVAALLAGCGGSSGSAHPPTVNLARAADVSSAAAGYKAVITLRETVPNAGAVDMTANGSFSPASHAGSLSMQMHLPASAGLGTLDMQMVLNKTTIYVKLPPSLASKIPGGKPWLYVNLGQIGQAAGIPGLGSLVSSSSSLSDPGQYLSFLRATAVGSVKNLGRATVNGVATTHYQAEIDLAKLPSVVPAAQRQAVQQLVTALQKKGAATEIPIDAWIDSSNLIRRIQMNFSEPVSSTGQSVAVAMTENFIQYGAQPAPVVPPASQSVNLLSLTHGTA